MALNGECQPLETATHARECASMRPWRRLDEPRARLRYAHWATRWPDRDGTHARARAHACTPIRAHVCGIRARFCLRTRPSFVGL